MACWIGYVRQISFQRLPVQNTMTLILEDYANILLTFTSMQKDWRF